LLFDHGPKVIARERAKKTRGMREKRTRTLPG